MDFADPSPVFLSNSRYFRCSCFLFDIGTAPVIRNPQALFSKTRNVNPASKYRNH